MPKGLVACLRKAHGNVPLGCTQLRAQERKDTPCWRIQYTPPRHGSLSQKTLAQDMSGKGHIRCAGRVAGHRTARADALEGNRKERVTKTAGTACLPGGAQAKPNTPATLSYTDSQGWEPRPCPNLVTSINHAQHHHACCGQAAKQGKLLP